MLRESRREVAHICSECVSTPARVRRPTQLRAIHRRADWAHTLYSVDGQLCAATVLLPRHEAAPLDKLERLRVHDGDGDAS